VGGYRNAPAALSLGSSHGTHCRGDWVGPRVDLDGYGGEKISFPTAFFEEVDYQIAYLSVFKVTFVGFNMYGSLKSFRLLYFIDKSYKQQLALSSQGGLRQSYQE